MEHTPKTEWARPVVYFEIEARDENVLIPFYKEMFNWDIGGGASIMGTLSGGGKEVISIGKRTLLGANSGIGISLGDDCIVEAGVYITAGSKIALPDGKIVKAKELNKASNLLFRRNSQTGSLEVLPKTGTWAGLNSILHSN